ncbi:MAG TPA: hypothetical protein VJT72_07860 [Pseudonocardiaceae bacterium]|nr:hypothetical protein [Pseudonocardiaceae bacterium]
MSEPTTAEGRALLDRISPPVGDQVDPEEEWVAEAWAHRNEIEGYILAIEAAAAEAERARIRAALLEAHEQHRSRWFNTDDGDGVMALGSEKALFEAALAAIDGPTPDRFSTPRTESPE